MEKRKRDGEGEGGQKGRGRVGWMIGGREGGKEDWRRKGKAGRRRGKI